MRALDNTEVEELIDLTGSLLTAVQPIAQALDIAHKTKNSEHLKTINMQIFTMLDVLETILDYASRDYSISELKSLSEVLDAFKSGNYSL